MFSEALSIIVSDCKPPKCSSGGEWTFFLKWYIQSMEYCQQLQGTDYQTNNLIKKWTEELNDIFPKKTYKRPISIWKRAQQSLEKCKSKPQAITSHLQGGSTPKRQEITSEGEDAEEGEPWCTAGGHGNWCSHYGKPWSSLKILKVELLQDPASYFWE